MQVLHVNETGDEMIVLHSNGVQMLYQFSSTGVEAFGSDGTQDVFGSPLVVGSLRRVMAEAVA